MVVIVGVSLLSSDKGGKVTIDDQISMSAAVKSEIQTAGAKAPFNVNVVTRNNTGSDDALKQLCRGQADSAGDSAVVFCYDQTQDSLYVTSSNKDLKDEDLTAAFAAVDRADKSANPLVILINELSNSWKANHSNPISLVTSRVPPRILIFGVILLIGAAFALFRSPRQRKAQPAAQWNGTNAAPPVYNPNAAPGSYSNTPPVYNPNAAPGGYTNASPVYNPNAAPGGYTNTPPTYNPNPTPPAYTPPTYTDPTEPKN